MAFPVQPGVTGGLPPLKRPSDIPDLGAAAKLPNLGLGGVAGLDAATLSSLGALTAGTAGLNGLLTGGSPPGGLGALLAPGVGGVSINTPPPPPAAAPIGPAPPPLGALNPALSGALTSALAALSAPAPPPPASPPPGLGAATLTASPTTIDANGKHTLTLDIPQAKVATVLGANQATLSAIATQSGATCNFTQGTNPGVVGLSITGFQVEVDKCRNMVESVVQAPQPAADPSALVAALAGNQAVAGLTAALAAPGALAAGGLNSATLTALASALGGVGAPPPPAVVPPITSLVSTGAAGTGGVGGAGSLDLSKLGALLTTPGGASLNYSHLIASLQGSGDQQQGAPSPDLAQLLTVGGEIKQSQAFDKDALARLAKEAKENPVDEVPAVTMETPGRAQPFALTAPAGTLSSIELPTKAVAPVVTPALERAAAAQVDDMLQQLQQPQEEKAQVAVAPVLDSTTVVGAMAKASPPPAPVAVPAPAVVSEPPPSNSQSFTGFTIMASSSTNKAPQKDASSVLGILQHAQANIASQRMGGARGMPPGTAPAPADGSMSGKVENSANGLDIVYKRLEVSATASLEMRKALEREIGSMLPKLDASRAADLVARTCAADAMRTNELLNHFCQVLQVGIPKFGSSQLTKATGALSAWAVALAPSLDSDGHPVLTQEVRSFFTAVATEVSLRLMDVAPGDLSRIANSLSSVGLAGIKLFSSLARAVVARSDRYAPAELVTLVAAFDRARFFHTGIFEALVKSLRGNISDMAPRDVLKGLTSLATCGVRDDVLGQLIGDHVLPKLHNGSLSAEELCSLAWVFCTLDLHHADLFRLAFRALEATPVVSGESLCQLYEIHLTLKAFHPDAYVDYELEDDIVQSLRAHYEKHEGGTGHKFKMQRSSERLHENVADQLREVIEGSVSKQHQTALGFSIDIAATKKKGSSAFMLLDIDGPHTLVRSLDPGDIATAAPTAWRVRGAVLLKRRLLQKYGFRIAAITEDSWNALDGNRDKRDHLRGILRNAGVEKDRIS